MREKFNLINLFEGMYHRITHIYDNNNRSNDRRIIDTEFFTNQSKKERILDLKKRKVNAV